MSIYTYPVIDVQLPSYTAGVWTPTLEFNGSSAGIISDIAAGTYSFLFNTVFFELYIKLSSKGVATGNATIGGLPQLSSVYSGDGRMVTYRNMSGVTSPGGFIMPNAGSINLTSSTSTETVNLTDANFTDTTEFALSGYYRFVEIS